MANVRRPIVLGSVFGSWTVVREAPKPLTARGIHYLCLCACGNERVVRASSLLGKETSRCRSCSNREAGRKTHGENRRGAMSPEYMAWTAMLARARRRLDKSYADVLVSPEWIGPGGFERFLAHIGRRPSPKHSLDRKDPFGDYEPGNVRWATATEQIRNRRAGRANR